MSSLPVSRTKLITLCASKFDHSVPFQTKHNKVFSLPQLERISWTMCDSAVTGHSVVPVACCVMVWPILPFLLFEIFMTAGSAIVSTSSRDVRGITTPDLNKSIFPATNCLVRVAGTRFSFLITNRGFVYSPTRSKK